jgi:hypothetical protein
VIVNRSGWASGNSLTVFCEDNGSSTGSLGYSSYDGWGNFSGQASYAPCLHITYYTLRVHDVAVVDVTPYRNWTYQGRLMNVSVTVANDGEYAENATVNLYFNSSTGNGMIGTKPVALTLDETKTLTFTWNTKGIPVYYNGYNITAVIQISPEIDINLTNNSLQSPSNVQVRIPGDINGDGKVDGRDMTVAVRAFGTFPGRPRWNPNADVNQHGRVDGRDITIVAKNFGKHDP